MDNKTNFIEPLLERVEIYGKTSYELIKLKALEKTTSIVSTLVSRTIFMIAFSMFIICLNIGIALWLGDLMGRTYYGFFCLAGFYIILGGVLYFLIHNWIKMRVSNSIIIQMLK